MEKLAARKLVIEDTCVIDESIHTTKLVVRYANLRYTRNCSGDVTTMYTNFTAWGIIFLRPR